MGDLFAGIVGEGEGIDPADREVPRVEAPANLVLLPDAIDVLRRLDQRADMGVEDVEETPVADDLVEARQHAAHVAPLRAVERDSWRPRLVDDGRGHEDATAGFLEQRGRGARLVEGDLGTRRVMEDQPDEAADEAQPELVELRPQVGGLVRKEPGRPQLGGREAHRRHLGKDAVDGQHPPPSRHLADTPRDRGTCKAIQEPHVSPPERLAVVVDVVERSNPSEQWC